MQCTTGQLNPLTSDYLKVDILVSVEMIDLISMGVIEDEDHIGQDRRVQVTAVSESLWFESRLVCVVATLQKAMHYLAHQQNPFWAMHATIRPSVH
jgi:hypothetical protein